MGRGTSNRSNRSHKTGELGARNAKNGFASASNGKFSLVITITSVRFREVTIGTTVQERGITAVCITT